MDQRRLLLAALLSLAVIIAWQILLPPPEPLPGDDAPLTTATSGGDGTPPSTVGREPVEPSPGAPEVAAEAIPAQPLAPEEAAAEQRLTVAGEGFRADLTNRGAQLLSFELTAHETSDGENVDLVRARLAGPYPFALTGAAGAPSALNDVLWVADREVVAGGEEVRFRYRGPAGSAEKRFLFRPDGQFEVAGRVEGSAEWGLFVGPGLRNPTESELGSQFARRSVAYRDGGEVEIVEADEVTERTQLPGAAVSWLGLQDTFFLTAVVPRRGLAGVTLLPMIPEAGDGVGPATWIELPGEAQATGAQKESRRELAVILQADGEELEALAVWGAKEYERLAELDIGLEDTVERGRYLGLLVQPLHWSLQWIHDHVVANYGWAIILMTVLIKLLLLPLTLKSMISMQKMQQLNPKIQAIRQKYRGKLKDKQGRPNAEMQRKMNDEVMALYRQEGVNPAGGCLPILLQIPILFAFYRLLYTTVELRRASWILWIQDLTEYDPYYVLPIVMGATQFLQQRLTPASGDPMQRRIFMLMPVIFTVLFLKFPSGLVLYWLTNNVLTIGQQVIYNRIKERAAAAAA